MGYKSNSRVVCIHTPAHVKIPHNAFLYVSFCTQNYGGRFLFIWIPFFLSNTMAIISAHAHTRRRVQDGWQISEQIIPTQIITHPGGRHQSMQHTSNLIACERPVSIGGIPSCTAVSRSRATLLTCPGRLLCRLHKQGTAKWD